MDTDYIATIDDSTESAQTTAQVKHSFRRFLSRSWKYAVVAIVSFLLGFATIYTASQSKILSLLEEIDSIRIQNDYDRETLFYMEQTAEKSGYERGYYSGYKDAEEELDEQYEDGYNFAMKSATSSMRLYRKTLEMAIYYNDKRIINDLMTLDMRSYLDDY